jgi:hypothetical protein
LDVQQGCFRNFFGGAGGQDGPVDFPKVFQPPVGLTQGLLGPFPLGDVALNPEVPGDPAGQVVKADVVAFNPDLSAVQLALITFDVQSSGIQHPAPEVFPVFTVVHEEVIGCQPDELFSPGPVLVEHGVIDLGDPLVPEDIFEDVVFVHRVVPTDRLIQYHEKETV